jgi:DNA helicase-2/ATP-dependent DNA helicase PcrA
MLEGTLHIADIRHVVIDEAQDYSYLQYQIIKRLFKYASFTILGDVNQAINTYMHTTDYKKAAEIFADYGSNTMVLTKSYRSTREIWELSERVLKSIGSQQPIGRHGEKPQFVDVGGNKMHRFTIQKLQEYSEQGMKSLAVICKTAMQCEELYKKVKEKIKLVNLITSENNKLTSGISIIPCYLAKGLEFDGVIIYDASQENYDSEEQRKLMYTMCTRALHKLCIVYTRELTHLLKDVDEEQGQFISL